MPNPNNITTNLHHRLTTVLSIVIVTSDGTQDTINCLDSIYSAPPSFSFEVILVDNCSTEPIVSIVSKQFPQVKNIFVEEKQGFSSNYNFGMRHAAGDYIMILNNDTLVHHGALGVLVSHLINHPSIGLAGPLLSSKDGTPQPVCARPLLTFWGFIGEQLFFDLGMPMGRLLNRSRQTRLLKRTTGAVPCISGACMVGSRVVFDHVGLLDEQYPLYFEDIEWCHRMQKNGYTVHFVAEAQVVHLGDQSISKVREWAKKSEYQGALRYYRQYYNMGYWREWVLWVAVFVGYIMRFLGFWFLEFTGTPGKSSTYARLIAWLRTQKPRKDSSVNAQAI